MQDANQKDPVLDGQPWRPSLEELERTLQEVGRAIVSLRQALEASDSSVEPPALRMAEPDSGAAETDDPPGSALEHARPLADVIEASTAENTVAAPKPPPTEFQRVWERHQRESTETGAPTADTGQEVEAGDSTGREAAGSLDRKTNEESSPEAEEEASNPTGYQQVWERLRKSQRLAGSEDRGDTEASPEDTTGGSGGGTANFDRVRERLRKHQKAAQSTERGDAEASPEDTAAVPGGGTANFDRVRERLRKHQKAAQSTERGDAETGPADPAGVYGSGTGNFDRVWERLKREREGRSEEGTESAPEPRGLGSLLKEYRMTIEDKDGTPVDLVPLHRALTAFAATDDISLAGYAKGTAIVGLRTEGELDLDRLASVIGAATMRHCEVIPQDQGKLFLRLSDEEEDDG